MVPAVHMSSDRCVTKILTSSAAEDKGGERKAGTFDRLQLVWKEDAIFC